MGGLRGNFRFDSVTHRYYCGDRPVPGITSVIRAADLQYASAFYTQESRDRGTAVHAAALEWDLTGEVVTLPASWQPYFDAYLAVRQALPCRWTQLEVRRLARRHGFAGTPDRVGRVRAAPAVVELKTGGASDWHGVQLAAQDLLLGGPRGQRRRIAFYLRADGTYRVQEYTDAGDYIQWMEALKRYGEIAAA